MIHVSKAPDRLRDSNLGKAANDLPSPPSLESCFQSYPKVHVRYPRPRCPRQLCTGGKAHTEMATPARGVSWVSTEILRRSQNRVSPKIPPLLGARTSITTPSPTPLLPSLSRKFFSTSPYHAAPGGSLLNSLGASNSSSTPSSYFQRPSLPANTIIRFVPQQTAWIVERMGKFNRILQPGLAILLPFVDRIAYVKSLKEAAIEIPSQSAITADNVTLELDGVLYTRVFDAYKARYSLQLTALGLKFQG